MKGTYTIDELDRMLVEARTRMVCGEDFMVRMGGRRDVARIEKAIERANASGRARLGS